MRILRQTDSEGASAGVRPGERVPDGQQALATPLNGSDPVVSPAAGAGRHAGMPGRPRRIGLLIGVAVFVIAADVISKSIVVAKMSDRGPIRLLGGLLMQTTKRRGRRRDMTSNVRKSIKRDRNAPKLTLQRSVRAPCPQTQIR